MVPFWLRYLPTSLRSKIEYRPKLLKALSNIAWLFSDKILRMGVGLLVGVWVARYLGPEQFGLINFALAFVAIFGAFATLGLQGIVVRDIVRGSARLEETLGTSFVLQLVGSLLAFLALVGIISYLRPDDILTKTVVAIFGFALIFKTSDVVKLWFESQVQSKYTVWVENSVFLVIAVTKVGLILGDAPIVAFAWAAFIEALLVAVALFAVYRWQGGKLISWCPRISRAKELLKDSWPLILSGLAVVIYLRIDQVMLGQMVGNEAVGIYSAAVQISGVWYFIGIGVVSSVYPALIEAKEISEKSYNEKFQKLYDLMVLLSVPIAVIVMFLSSWIIDVLFGAAYKAAGEILFVHIWAAIFVFLGKASSKWFFIENRQILILYRSVIGALINVALNFLLIPEYGAVGAAYATIISYVCISLVFDLFRDETRPMFWMKLKAFNLFRSAHFLYNGIGKN